MNWTDFLIIYLAGGTPFGVYYFFQNQKSNSHRLKSLLVIFVWIPYALKLLSGKLSGRFPFQNYSQEIDLISENESKLETVKKNLENFLIEKSEKFPTFEYREIIERYAGLSVAVSLKNLETGEKIEKFYEIAGSDAKKTAALCLHRRNLKLLFFHQKLARKDFLKFVSGFELDLEDRKTLQKTITELFEILRDLEAKNFICQYFADTSQTSEIKSVAQMEKILCPPEQFNTTSAKPTISTLETVNAITPLPLKK